MLTTPWTKVLIDLWEHRARTLIVALAIAVGIYAVGVVLDVREMVVREYRRDQGTGQIASAIIYTQPFEEDLADGVSKLPMVAAAEGRIVVRGRVLRDGGIAQDIELIAAPDFSDMSVDAITPLTGVYPPARREVLLEAASVSSLDARVGQELTIELNNDATRKLVVAGTVHDPQQFSPALSGSAVGYVTPETMRSLGYENGATELRMRATEPARDEAHVAATMGQVEDYLKESGRTILSRRIITSGPADPYIDSVVLLLTGFGLLILVLSGFLVVNAMSALITQQIPQIGVMKLIGARRRQIIALYLATVLIYGVIAVAMALPLAALSARLLMTQVVEKLLNVMLISYAVPVPMLVAQAAVGLLLPLVAGLFPVLRGTSITTSQALNELDLGGGGGGRSIVDSLLARVQKIRRIKRPVLLAIRNTLRHKGRLAQTLIVLVLGTALFVAVLSVRASVDATLSTFMRFHQYDVSVEMQNPELVVRLVGAARQVPGVTDVEVWSTGRATRVRTDDSKGNPTSLVAVPADTTFIAPEMIAGQWLVWDQDTAGAAPIPVPNALVVNSDFADDERDVTLGSDVILEIDGREATWHVVGIVTTESRGPAVYVTHDDYAYATRAVGEGTQVNVRTAAHDAASQAALASRLQEHLNAAGLKADGARTASMTQGENKLLFTVVVTFLILMALLLAAVGGLGLTTTMSINMMERVREVGVLRAIGASNASVRKIVLAEGIAIAVLSWGAGTLLSLFISPLFSAQLGLALIKVPLHYNYSIGSAIAWFFILVAIAIVASLGPARNAARLTVREVLAYE
jgi:putative ABC transport system permease protein